MIIHITKAFLWNCFGFNCQFSRYNFLDCFFLSLFCIILSGIGQYVMWIWLSSHQEWPIFYNSMISDLYHYRAFNEVIIFSLESMRGTVSYCYDYTHYALPIAHCTLCMYFLVAVIRSFVQSKSQSAIVKIIHIFNLTWPQWFWTEK